MSDSDMLKVAEAEVARLEAELALTPTYQKLQAAKKIVELYTAKPHPIAARPASFAGGGSEVNVIRRVGNLIVSRPISADTKVARIDAAAVEFLKKRGSRATSSELLEAMKAAGIQITGKEPIKALSAYLSNSKSLNNIRELGGYGLVEWGNARGADMLTGVFK